MGVVEGVLGTMGAWESLPLAMEERGAVFRRGPEVRPRHTVLYHTILYHT